MTKPGGIMPSPNAARTPREAITDLGFDPAAVQTVILTSTAAVGIAVDYPEPYVLPEA